MEKCISLFSVILISLMSSVTCADTFHYFAYGSNLFKKRLNNNSPSAVFIAAVELKDYRLDFIRFSPAWQGAVATIVEDPGRSVWGALWKIDKSNMASLDHQEGVDNEWYYAKDVRVVLGDGTAYKARTYEQTANPPLQSGGTPLPPDRRPSTTYQQVIIFGAYECLLPAYYIEQLYNIRNNGRNATKELREQLGDQF